MIIYGTNLIGASDPTCDPILHPELPLAVKSCNMEYVRFWLEGSLGTTADPKQWPILLKWNKLGYKTIAVINFQNSPVRCKAPTDAQWTTYINSIPAPSVTGVTCFEIGNELDYDAYYTDTVQNYAKLLKIAYPILNKKGYKVIVANCLFNLNWYKELYTLGAFSYCDYIGRHAYETTPASNFAAIDEVIAYAKSIGKEVLCTEGGIRGKSTDLPGWATLTKDYYYGLQTRNGVVLHFPLFTLPTDPLDIGSILTPEYKPTPYFNAAMIAGTNIAVIPVIPPSQSIAGTPIGTPGSFSNQGNTIAKVFDGNPDTFFDAPTASGSWVGLDFGSGKVITKINFSPRTGWSGFSERMVGGVFQGANQADFSDAVILATIVHSPPSSMTTSVSVSNPTSFRYARYFGPPNGDCNIAELSFFGG